MGPVWGEHPERAQARLAQATTLLFHTHTLHTCTVNETGGLFRFVPLASSQPLVETENEEGEVVCWLPCAERRRTLGRYSTPPPASELAAGTAIWARFLLQ